MVQPGDGRLVDRTGKERLGTTDPEARAIWIDSRLRPPMLDRVLLHEVAHAVTVSHGMLGALRSQIPTGAWVPAEEWAAQLLEGHAIEAVDIASAALGRPVCVDGRCLGGRAI